MTEPQDYKYYDVYAQFAENKPIWQDRISASSKEEAISAVKNRMKNSSLKHDHYIWSAKEVK